LTDEDGSSIDQEVYQSLELLKFQVDLYLCFLLNQSFDLSLDIHFHSFKNYQSYYHLHSSPQLHHPLVKSYFCEPTPFVILSLETLVFSFGMHLKKFPPSLALEQSIADLLFRLNFKFKK